MEVFKDMVKKGKMTKSMRTGIVSLIYKKGQSSSLANYRQLTMVCVDYKIWSR